MHLNVTVTGQSSAPWNHDHEHPIGQVDLGHPEALAKALEAQAQVEVLKDKIKQATEGSALKNGILVQTDPHTHAASKNGGECPCGCGTQWTGLDTGSTTEAADALAAIGKAFSQMGKGVAEMFDKIAPMIGELATNIATIYGVPVTLVIGKTKIGTHQADYVLQPSAKPNHVDVFGPSEGQPFVCKGEFPVIGIHPDLLKPLATGGILHHTASPAGKVDPGSPLVVGQDWYAGFDGSQHGGHALAAAFLDTHGVLHFQNSWGKYPTCICVTSGPDMDGPDAECPIHGVNTQVYSQAQVADHWGSPDSDPVGDVLKAVEHYKGVSLKGASVTSEITGATPEQIALAFGVPVEVITGMAAFVSTDPPVPTLFADDDPPPVDESSHRWCNHCAAHWDLHVTVTAYCADSLRPSTVAEEKHRAVVLRVEGTAA